MLFAASYLIAAGLGFMLVQVALHRLTKPRLGMAYLRTSLGLSFCLVALDTLAVLIVGVWWIPVPLAVGLGFALPGMMLAIT